MSTSTNLDNLRQELSILENRVEAVETRLAQKVTVEPSSFDLTSVMEGVRRITKELFPGKCEFTNEFDPEYPEDRYVVVNVEAAGDPREIAERGCVWDERIRQLSPDLFGNLRLSIAPR